MLFALVISVACPLRAAADARMSDSHGKLPLHFEANQDQAHQDVRFLARGSGYSLYLTAGEAVLVLAKTNPVATLDAHITKARLKEGIRAEQSRHEQRDAQAQVEPLVLRMSLVGARSKPIVSGLEELPGKANYFIGRDPAKWRTNVPTYAKVHYQNVYPGIDLVYYGNQRQLEYDFVVAPGADPKKIVLGFKGADRLEIDAEGDLVLHVPEGAIRQKKPVIYQEVDGIRREVAGSYVRKGANRVGFKLAAYDTSRPLIIDPVVLSYSTYLGGSGNDSGEGIAVDADGNAYVTGTTNSSDFPTTAGAFQTIFRGGHDVFVTKLNPAGSAFVYSTYLGGGGEDFGSGIAVDAAGNAYVTGVTQSTDFPTTAGAFQTTGGGGFVTKLDPTGSALVYSTVGIGLHGITVDADGNAYVAGDTCSPSYPTTPGAFQTKLAGINDCDVVVTKLNPTGSALVYSTYLGGTEFDSFGGIAVDAAGNAYVTGTTQSGNFPITPGAFQPFFGGIADAFVTKLHSSGSILVYSTYLGDTGGDGGSGIAVDADGNAYVTGSTSPSGSRNFPTTEGAFDTTSNGGLDAFVTKLHSSGSLLVYSTYLGGIDFDFGGQIALDGAGNAYVTGQTQSLNFPTTAGAFQSAHAGGHGDVYVTKLNPAGSALVYSTYFGGSNNEFPRGIAVDTHASVYVTGSTWSTDFPIAAGAVQPVFGGGASSDAFVAKIVDAGTTRSEESAPTYTGFWPTYGPEMGTFSGGTVRASNQPVATATFSFTGTAVTWIGVKCNVCGIATVSIDGGAPATVNTFGPGVPGSLVSEPVFFASGLAPDVTHTLVITVTGASAADPGYLTGSAHVAVDAFDVTP
jgi:hypothetical protein